MQLRIVVYSPKQSNQQAMIALTRRHTSTISATKSKQAIRRVFNNRQLIERFCQ